MNSFCRNLAPVLLLLSVSCSNSDSTKSSANVKETINLEAKPSPEIAQRPTALTDADKSKFNKRVEFPSTGEMFQALDKLLKNIDWKSAIPADSNIHYSKKTLQALNLGARVADAFAAARAKDEGKLEQITKSIDGLSHDLGVPASLMGKRDSMLDDARKGQWAHLQQSLDDLQGGVLKEVDAIGEKDTATLALLGGWIEGMRITTTALSQNYNGDASGILYQPAIINQLIVRYDAMKPDIKSEPAVALIGSKLHQIQTMCNVGKGKPVDKKTVTELQAISSNLVKTITREA